MNIGIIITIIVVSWISFALGMIFGLFMGTSPVERQRFDDWSEGYRAGTNGLRHYSTELDDRNYLN